MDQGWPGPRAPQVSSSNSSNCAVWPCHSPSCQLSLKLCGSPRVTVIHPWVDLSLRLFLLRQLCNSSVFSLLIDCGLFTKGCPTNVDLMRGPCPPHPVKEKKERHPIYCKRRCLDRMSSKDWPNREFPLWLSKLRT